MLILDEQQKLYCSGSCLFTMISVLTIAWLQRAIIIGACFNVQFLYIKLFIISKTSIVRPPTVQRIWP